MLSLRWRLIVSYIILAVLVIAALGLLLISILSRNFEISERRALEANARVVAQEAARLWQPQPDVAMLRLLAESYGTLGQTHVTIFDAHSHPLVEFNSSSNSFWASVESFDEALSSQPEGLSLLRIRRSQPSAALEAWILLSRQVEPASGFSFSALAGQEPPTQQAPWGLVRVLAPVEVTVPVPGPNGPLGYVRISEITPYRQQVLLSVQQAFLAASLVAVALAVALGLAMGQGLAAPLRTLTVATERMAHGDLSARASLRRRDELGALASRFNEMASRLQESFQTLAADRDQLRRFVADVSHELRTPITALRTFIELLQTTSEDDVAARQEFLAESAAQLERLDRLTSNLLELSKLDAGLIPMALAEEEAGELLLRTRGRWLAIAEKQGISLRLELPAHPLCVRCDRLRIEQVLDNLVSNAVKFVGAGGTVTLGGREGAQASVEFWVADNGPGINPEDLPHIFERFYRGHNPRGEGSGLGLAIVKAILAAHDTDVQVESKPGQGSRFSFTLAAAQAS